MRCPLRKQMWSGGIQYNQKHAPASNFDASATAKIHQKIWDDRALWSDRNELADEGNCLEGARPMVQELLPLLPAAHDRAGGRLPALPAGRRVLLAAAARSGAGGSSRCSRWRSAPAGHVSSALAALAGEFDGGGGARGGRVGADRVSRRATLDGPDARPGAGVLGDAGNVDSAAAGEFRLPRATCMAAREPHAAATRVRHLPAPAERSSERPAVRGGDGVAERFGDRVPLAAARTRRWV